ncbi:winged helix-turn-helix domain-containing protein [Leekyejoonella antrihumi]|uniref:Winged helix-turn-helix domain-containing protein n=1 Tax=Leekyejoonella antrihumi TaxID=1660198 RepID=A0A563EBA2_9MICO|nr:winged helix-turn-helix domain-containing protein [Leekyejoonella antrihumi]
MPHRSTDGAKYQCQRKADDRRGKREPVVAGRASRRTGCLRRAGSPTPGTRDLVQRLIWVEFGVRMSSAAVGRMLHKLGSACRRSGRCGGAGRPTRTRSPPGRLRSTPRSPRRPRRRAGPCTSRTRPVGARI